MCWWTQFKLHIRSKDDCRNLSALIFQQYKTVAKETLISIIDIKKTPLPHTIPHDDRCLFVAIIAAIIDEQPSDGFGKCIEFAEMLKKYKADKKDIDESEILCASIIQALCIAASATIKKYSMSSDTENHIRNYSAAVNAAIRSYIDAGSVGSFGVKYLLSLPMHQK
jgi:hypothetical protein